ncbi:M28 family peptidase [Brevundimonas lutea]|uniref:M28 family peptidase n=1 Tax=Brevundimonas lutea TaxID=2293980 RepID=UPI000F0380C1|nr:M28 family peptidase [Brevundimonas lutea]
MIRFAPPLAALATLALGACATVGGASENGEVSAERLNAYVRELADDRYGGRGPGTPGEELTVQWIADQFETLGLEPAGPGGAFLQDVPISRTRQDGPATITVASPAGERTLERGTQVLVSSDRPRTRITVADAPVIFAGYGVTAPEKNWDDFKGVDVAGKILLVLVNDPDFEVPAGHPTANLFEGQAMTYYGRWVYKFQEAARLGAAGVLVIHETEAAGYPWSVLENSSTAPKLDIVRADPDAERVPAQGWIQRDVAARMLADAGLDYAALKTRSQNADFQPVELEGVTMSLDFGQSVDRFMSRNVVARLPGTTHPDEHVMFGAHWDAYGRAAPDDTGDDIYNGAVDNATGVAGVLEMARLFAEAPRTDRSTIFVAWAAEEAGLLGAYHYAANPLVPLETTVANFNLDSLLPGETVEPEVVVIGYGKNQLDDWLAEQAAEVGRRLIPDPAPQAGAFYRSDHFPLALKGVPALFPAAGFTGASAASRDYVDNRYHQPSDEWDASWTMEAAAQDVQLMYKTGRALADSRAWPEWSEGSEFTAARQASADQRD